jgi:integrase
MARVKSKKYEGIYLNHLQNGDISYSLVYKDLDNKMQRLTIGKKSQGITEQYCNQKRIEVINKITLGEQPTSIKKRAKKSIITLDEVASKYFFSLEKRSTLKSIRDRVGKYNKHLASLKNKDITAVSKNDLVAIQNKMQEKKLSPKTINQVTELFGTIFNFGLKEEMFSQPNPTAKVERFDVENTRDRFLTLEEIQALFDTIKDDTQLLLFVKMALCTGARLEGLLSIQKKDIDLSNGIVNLNDYKTKSTYRGFLSQDVIVLLRDILKYAKANDYIFGLEEDKKTKRQLQRKLKPILDDLFNQDLDLDDRKNRVVIHTLRHTFASHLAINGTPIYTIQKLMNHRDIKMTLRYAKLAPDSGKEFVLGLYQQAKF